MKTMPKALYAAKLFLEQFGPSPSVYIWYQNQRPPLHIGLRVAEVSYVSHNPDGTVVGSSYMQSDPDGLAVCAAVERLIIAYMQDEDVELYENAVQHLVGGA